MPTPTRVLTNDYKDCKLIHLDSNDHKSPLVVMQEGYSPSDASCRMRMFYLQRKGFWIDEVARSTRPETEIADIVFDTAGDAVNTLSRMFGKPLVREIPVSEADVQKYM